MSCGVVLGEASGLEKLPVQPSIGRTTGKGCSGSTKETWRMELVLMMLWTVS